MPGRVENRVKAIHAKGKTVNIYLKNANWQSIEMKYWQYSPSRQKKLDL